MSENTELIWVTKEQADALKRLESAEGQKSFVDDLINRRKIDIQNSIEALDDDLLRLKAFTLNYKTELKKAYEEQDKALEDLWIAHDEKIAESKKKIKQLLPELQEVKKQIDDVTRFMNEVSTYSINRLLEIVHKVNNMPEEDKKLMSDLINLNRVK